MWVYPCTYRELNSGESGLVPLGGISLYLQGTHLLMSLQGTINRYIPVPTGNSQFQQKGKTIKSVYPCTYRELPWNMLKTWINSGISLYLQGTHMMHHYWHYRHRYIPVPTGNSTIGSETGGT